MFNRLTFLALILSCTSLSFSQISELPYNPFEYGKRLMMNICVHHLHYKEKILKEDILNSYIQLHGYPPDTMVGNPENTESGMLYGLLFKYMKRYHKTGIFIRPQLEVALGFDNAYEVSTQDQSPPDEIDQNTGIHFKTIDTVKNNTFLNTEFDIGYCNTNIHLPFALYSGLRLAFWITELPLLKEFENYENCFRWSLPVGLIINKPVSNCWSLGCEFTFDLMLSGGVMTMVEVKDDEYEINSPEVSLSNRGGYRLELYADGLLTERFSLRFAPYLNYYRFGKSNSGYQPINGRGVSNTNIKIPSECTTIMAGMNITFTILMSGD